jgi:transcriptional repressor NrdR
VANACNKRPVSVDDITTLVDDVAQTLRQEGKGEVDSFVIGEHVMQRLFQLDQVAYVRFASVYQRFDDVKRFAQLLERMTRSAKRLKRPGARLSNQELEINDETKDETR